MSGLTFANRIGWCSTAEAAAVFGKTIILSDNLALTSEELVRYYTGKYHVEHGFRQLNDPDQIAVGPIYCWTDSKIRVYALMCVVAQLVLQLMN